MSINEIFHYEISKKKVFCSIFEIPANELNSDCLKMATIH